MGFQYQVRSIFAEGKFPKNSIVNYRAVYKNLEYFENIGPNWSKLGSFVDKHRTLDVIDLIFGSIGKKDIQR